MREPTHDEDFADAWDGLLGELSREDEALDGLMLQGLRQRMGLTVEPPRVGRFVIEQTLGEGGMGVVYAALDPRVGRRVALKVMRRRPGGVEPDLREARALARLCHPNVITVYEGGVYEGRVFMAMELVEGPTLRSWLGRPHPWRSVCETVGAAGRGLAAAHAVGIVHRDFKPGNVLLGSRVRVADFGLAIPDGRHDGSEGRSDDVSPRGSDGARTPASPGRRPGTFAYMAPEQLRGEAVDARADQFSLCVVLYEALAGVRPFDEDEPRRRLEAIEAGADPAPLVRAPRWLRALVLRGLHARPERRYPDLTTLLDAMERRRWPRSLAVAGLAAVVATPWLVPSETPPCEGSRAQLDGVWDEARRRSLDAAFEATGLSYAADASARSQRALDAYAQGWVEAHEASCRATHVHGTQSPEVLDLRMRCLQQRRSELVQTVGVLVEANEARVRKAGALVAELPSLARCDDLEAMQATVPPPEDLATLQQVEALRERVALAWSLGWVAEFEQATVEAEAVVERSEALGYLPLVAEALHLQAWLHYSEGRYTDAVEELERAYLLAVELEHEVVVTKTIDLLVFALGEQLGDLERAAWWNRQAEAHSRRLGDEPLATISMLRGQGSLHSMQGRYDAAIEDYRRVLALQRSAGAGPLHEAGTLNNLGAVLEKAGWLDEAIVHLREALSFYEEAVGPRHPRCAIIRNNLGSMLMDQGRYEDAIVEHQRAREIWEEALGPEHPSVGIVWANLGNVYQAQGRLDESLAAFERTRALWVASLGPEHVQVGQILNNMGDVLALLHRTDEALAHMKQALTILESSMGPDHPYVARSLANLGLLYRQRGQFDEAARHLERARSIYENGPDPDTLALAHALVGLARVELSRGAPQVAHRWAERAVAVLEAGDPPRSELAYARLMQARALWADPEQRVRARSLAERSRAEYEQLEDSGRAMAERIGAWLEDPDGVDDDFSLAAQEPRDPRP